MQRLLLRSGRITRAVLRRLISVSVDDRVARLRLPLARTISGQVAYYLISFEMSKNVLGLVVAEARKQVAAYVMRARRSFAREVTIA